MLKRIFNFFRRKSRVDLPEPGYYTGVKFDSVWLDDRNNIKVKLDFSEAEKVDNDEHN